MINTFRKAFFAFLIFSLLFTLPTSQNSFAQEKAQSVLNLKELFDSELPPGQYFTVKDDKTGELVTKIGRYVNIGDEVITSDNKHYRVNKINGRIATAKFLGIDKTIAWNPEWDQKLAEANVTVPTQGNGANNKIGIYHTHSDESYVPTDGSESVPNKGGIFKVGTVFAKQLEKEGVNAVLSLRPHEPHDANAYHRSRRTALQLLKQRPIALIDVHRDGVPDPDFYTGEVKEAPQTATAIRLVVGRQNANMRANLQFAKDIKAYMDKEKPGLIKEIFMAKGNYNQDLGPRAILIEAGTHTNKREEAQKGVALFAEALPNMLGIQDTRNKQAAPGPGNTGPASPNNFSANNEDRASWSSLWIILGALIIGGGAFLLISTGSIKGSKEKLGQFFSKEWANAFGVKDDNSSKYERMRKKTHEVQEKFLKEKNHQGEKDE